MQCEVFALLAVNCWATKQANLDLSEMSNSEFTTNEDEGKEAWNSLSAQLFELKGFLRSMLLSFLSFFKRNFLLLFGVPILFFGATFGWYSFQDPTFEASMTVSYVHLEKKIYADMIVKLNQSIQSEMIQKMPGFSSLSNEANASLEKVDAINLRGEALTSDLSVDRVPFDLLVEVNNLEYLSSIEQALVEYLDSPVFVQERLAFNTANAKKQARYYTEQISSLQKRLDEIDTASDSDDFELLMDRIVDANIKLAEAEGQLKFNSNIEVLHGFQAGSAKKIDQGKDRAKMAAVAGLLFALMIGFFRP